MLRGREVAKHTYACEIDGAELDEELVFVSVSTVHAVHFKISCFIACAGKCRLAIQHFAHVVPWGSRALPCVLLTHPQRIREARGLDGSFELVNLTRLS